MNSSIVFFDGVCNLCNGWVDFLFRRISAHPIYFKGKFFFAPLQGNTAQLLLTEHLHGHSAQASVVFYAQGKIHVKSDAVVEILCALGGLWDIFRLLRVIPRALRSPVGDFFYDIIASHRYAWFGKQATCRLPTPQEREYFLD